MAHRLQAMGQANYRNGFKLTLHPHALDLPLRWKTPQMIFVNSMSDLLHKDVPLDFIEQAFEVMRKAHWHTFQVLTKRSERLAELAANLDWPPNVWMGVSVENNHYQYRIDDLRKTKAFIKFISIEPLLGSLRNLDLSCINWVIVGGESGPYARPMQESWVLEIRDQCNASNVPFFFKQWGGVRKKQAGRLLENRMWDELPQLASN
jgi:protein gp37